MGQTPTQPETLSLEIPSAIALHVTQEQFEALSAANRDLRLERTTAGELIVNPPTGGETGYRNIKSEYIDNGAKLGWLIDPQNRRVEIYRAGRDVEVWENPPTCPVKMCCLDLFSI